MCLCVSLPVSALTGECMITKFGTRIDLYDILDDFDGACHRSKVKVTRSKNVISRVFFQLSAQIPNPGIWCNVMMSHDIMTSHT